MNLDSLSVLFVPKSPWCLKTFRLHSDLTNGLWSFQQQHPESVIIFLRGKKMRTVQGVFDEFSAALQFPYYFGENGNAFDECLGDLSWLPAKQYVLTIFDSGDFLVGEPEQLPLFIDALERACRYWNVPISQGESWDRPAVPFHVIFHCVPEEAQRLPEKIACLTHVI